MDLTAGSVTLFSSAALAISLISFLCTGCSGPAPGKSADLDVLLVAPAGWKAGALKAAYQPSNLHEYLNGGAERYLGYGFRELRVAEFVSESNQYTIYAEIYQMDSPANAYGIFSSDQSGDNPGDIGSDAALGDYLLQFWQGPYFVRIQDVNLTGGLRGQIEEFGRVISRAIPFPAGEGRPAILTLLPAEGLITGSVRYFHTLNSLNSLVYLGNTNTLGLSDSTEAVSGEYYADTVSQKVCRLVVIRYPDTVLWEKILEISRSGGFEFPPEAGLIGHQFLPSLLVLFFGESEPAWRDRQYEYINQRISQPSGGKHGQ